MAYLPQLDVRAAGLFAELGIDSHCYLSKANRAIDSIVLAEGIDCANIIAGLDQLDYALFDSDYLGTLSLLLADEAQELCSKDEFEEAFSRQDEANCLARFLHSYGQLLVEDSHAFEPMGKYVAPGERRSSMALDVS